MIVCMTCKGESKRGGGTENCVLHASIPSHASTNPASPLSIGDLLAHRAAAEAMTGNGYKGMCENPKCAQFGKADSDKFWKKVRTCAGLARFTLSSTLVTQAT